MDEKTPTLARRLAAYSATASVALAVAPEAGAQVVYHDFEPDVVTCDFYLDLDDDGIDDIRVAGGVPSYCYGRYYNYLMHFIRPVDADNRNGALGFQHSYCGIIANKLSSGETIGPAGPGQDFYRSPLIASVYTSANHNGCGLFHDAEGYAAFRFVAGDGQLHYGWIRLSTPRWPLIATLYEYAYELQPDTPILAGAVSAALLDGAVDQTTFPASGGTLRYTFTVENTTGAPLPLDLWLDADGPAAFTRRLGSGTLPPGATVTRTVRIGLRPGVPPGDYDVRFRLGHFASERFITFERYEVVKEGAAAGVTGEVFAVELVEGDLFAEAAASALAGTHALSAPVPNPSPGQSQFTLEVTEAQHVVVAVHDALGRRVALLHDGPLAVGAAHRLVFDGSGLPAGVYVVRAVGETFADTRVLTLAR